MTLVHAGLVPTGIVGGAFGAAATTALNYSQFALLTEYDAELQDLVHAAQNNYKSQVDKSINPRSTGRLSTPPDTIDGLDCSGFTCYALYQAAGLVIPDGSENQLEWFQREDFRRLEPYSNVNEDMGHSVLYIAFIKAHVNGCGAIGHVWLVYKRTDEATAETFECHGGGGVDSRPWNTAALFHEEYMAFELPIG
jgi:hypothetical protein